MPFSAVISWWIQRRGDRIKNNVLLSIYKKCVSLSEYCYPYFSPLPETKWQPRQNLTTWCIALSTPTAVLYSRWLRLESCLNAQIPDYKLFLCKETCLPGGNLNVPFACHITKSWNISAAPFQYIGPRYALYASSFSWRQNVSLYPRSCATAFPMASLHNSGWKWMVWCDLRL